MNSLHCAYIPLKGPDRPFIPPGISLVGGPLGAAPGAFAPCPSSPRLIAAGTGRLPEREKGGRMKIGRKWSERGRSDREWMDWKRWIVRGDEGRELVWAFLPGLLFVPRSGPAYWPVQLKQRACTIYCHILIKSCSRNASLHRMSCMSKCQLWHDILQHWGAGLLIFHATEPSKAIRKGGIQCCSYFSKRMITLCEINNTSHASLWADSSLDAVPPTGV